MEPVIDDLGNDPQPLEGTDVAKGLSFGEKLVGLSFNPSGNLEVNRVKQICAELVDLLHEYKNVSYEVGTLTALKEDIIDRAFMDILAAQMMSVKALTLNY